MGLFFILLYFILLHFVILEAYSFLIRHTKGMYPDGKGDEEELGGKEGG